MRILEIARHFLSDSIVDSHFLVIKYKLIVLKTVNKQKLDFEKTSGDWAIKKNIWADLGDFQLNCTFHIQAFLVFVEFLYIKVSEVFRLCILNLSFKVRFLMDLKKILRRMIWFINTNLNIKQIFIFICVK